MKKPNHTMQIIMTVIYCGLLAGTLTGCIILYFDATLGLLEFILIIAAMAVFCVPFPCYFVYILIKSAIGRASVKNGKVYSGKIAAIEPHPNKTFSVFFARFAIKNGDTVYYTPYLYYTNAVKDFKGVNVDFVTDKKTAYIEQFDLEKK